MIRYICGQFWWKSVDPYWSYCPFFWTFFDVSDVITLKKSSPQKLLHRIQWKLVFLFFLGYPKQNDCLNFSSVKTWSLLLKQNIGSDSSCLHISPKPLGLAKIFQLQKWSLLYGLWKSPRDQICQTTPCKSYFPWENYLFSLFSQYLENYDRKKVKL